MTVPYSKEVATSSFFCLYRLLFKWKGSIWQLVWQEYIVWLIFYLILSMCYRFLMTEFQRESVSFLQIILLRVFEDISVFCNTYSTFIPITFMLGWIDTPGLAIAAHVEGTSEVARNLRRNCVRHLCLLQAIVFRDISVPVKKRFPTMNHLVTAGLMTEAELEHFNAVPSKNAKYWVLTQWVFANLRTARQMGLISSDMALVSVNEKIYAFRNSVVYLTIADWVSVPLAYSQVCFFFPDFPSIILFNPKLNIFHRKKDGIMINFLVVHLAVRMFFILALMGRQFLAPARDELQNWTRTSDIYIPIGWIKVAEVMLNPLGEDNDDFETNWIIDRNLQVGLCMVDDQFDKLPKMERDAFWEDVEVEPLYTPETATVLRNPQIGSCVDISLAENQNEIVPVVGLERQDSSRSRRGSLQSITRRLSAVVKNIRIKGRNRQLEPKRSTAAPSNETNCTSYDESLPDEYRSRESSANMSAVETPSTSHLKRKTAITPRTRMISGMSIQELSEINEENSEDAPTAPPRTSRAFLRATSNEPKEIKEEHPNTVNRHNSWI